MFHFIMSNDSNTICGESPPQVRWVPITLESVKPISAVDVGKTGCCNTDHRFKPN